MWAIKTRGDIALLARLRAVGVALTTAPSVTAATLALTVSRADSSQVFQRAGVELSPEGREAFTDELCVAEFRDLVSASTPRSLIG